MRGDAVSSLIDMLHSGLFTAPLQQDRFYSLRLSVLSRGGGVGASKKAKGGVLSAALKFCFGCFFQLQNRLRARLQHKGMSMHHFLQPFRGEWGARRGFSPGYPSAGVTRILQSSRKRRARGGRAHTCSH